MMHMHRICSYILCGCSVHDLPFYFVSQFVAAHLKVYSTYIPYVSLSGVFHGRSEGAISIYVRTSSVISSDYVDMVV